MTAAGSLNVDDTTACPVADTCAGCGQPGDDLVVATAGTVLGVLCLTLCDVCADAGIVPVRSAVATTYAVLDHCDHLGCDIDEMAAATGGDRT